MITPRSMHECGPEFLAAQGLSRVPPRPLRRSSWLSKEPYADLRPATTYFSSTLCTFLKQSDRKSANAAHALLGDEEEQRIEETMSSSTQWTGTASVKGSTEHIRMSLLTFCLVGLQSVCCCIEEIYQLTFDKCRFTWGIEMTCKTASTIVSRRETD